MKIKPKKVYNNIFEAMKDIVDRFRNKEDIFSDGDIVEIDLSDEIEFEVEVKDED